MTSEGTWNAYARSRVATANNASRSPKSLICIVVRAQPTAPWPKLSTYTTHSRVRLAV